MKDFREYLKENSGVVNTVTTDYKQALMQLAVKPGSKEWKNLLYALDGDEKLANAVLENAAAEAANNFLRILGIAYNPNAERVPGPERNENAWVGDKGETVGVINYGA